MNNLLDQKKIGILIGALIVIGVGVYFVQSANEKKDQEGKSALFKISKTFEEEMKALPEDQRAPGTTFDVDAKLSKTVSELNGLINAKNASSNVLYEAALRLGTLYMDHGQADKATSALQKTTTFAHSNFQKASAYYVLGVSEERANRMKEAVAAFQEGLAKNVDGLNGEFLLELVRTHLKLNEKDTAKHFADRLNKDLPSSRAGVAAQELVK